MEFPLGLAQVQRQLLLAKAVELGGFEVIVLCRYGIHNIEDGIESNGVYEGIQFNYCSGTSVRSKNFLRRNLLKFKGLVNEFLYYRKYSATNQLAGVLVSTNSFHNILFYFFLGKIFNVISVVDNVEYWTSNKKFSGFDRIDKLFYDKYYFLFSDKVICISDFLIRKVRGEKIRKVIKIPAITDFEKYKRPENYLRLVKERYLLYCGSDAYSDVIDFVISSYERLNFDSLKLVLVTRNNQRLEKRINKVKNKNNIMVMQNIPYEDLINLYLNSEALLIPLRNIDQDKARFPHKISEYCASGRPIITSNVGEIANYFDETSVYLCNDYNESEFADKMNEVILDPEKAEEKAKRSYEIGNENFNYTSYSDILVKFLTEK